MRWLKFLLPRRRQSATSAFMVAPGGALEDPKRGSVLADSDGLKLATPDGRVESLHWSDVTEVRAYKQDLFTYDLICLEFAKAGTSDVVSIHEEMAGYGIVHDMLHELFPGIGHEWWSRVAFPAFTENFQVIWKRDKPSEPKSAP